MTFLGRIKVYDLYEESSMRVPTVPQGWFIDEPCCMSNVSTGEVLWVFLCPCSSSSCQEETLSDNIQQKASLDVTDGRKSY